MERLILIKKVESGMKPSESGERISDAELDIEVEKWFKYTGLIKLKKT